MQHNSSSRTPSPSSSPSLAPIDSSPPSSPSLYPIKTPPASPGTKDPFAGSSKAVKHPRIYERHGRKRSFGDLSPFERHLDTLTRAEDATPTRTARVMDPFSGSAKRHWRPPAYEKKTPTSGASETAGLSSSPSPPPTRHSHTSPTPIHRAITTELGDPDDDFCLTEDEADYPRLFVKSPSKVELEHELWDRQITAAIEKLHGVIDLSGTNLGGHITYIPSSIEELAIRTVLPRANSPSSVPSSPTLSPTPPPQGLSFPPSPRTFARATTVAAPAFNDAFFRSKDGERLRGTPAARAASLRAIAEQPATRLRRPELHMYLANNTISQLPPELFRVTSLTVLSLRANCLTSIPPQITHLHALQELNVAQNKLQWLPAEMIQMKLTKLTVSGNPWLPPPPLPNDLPESKPTSETIPRFTIPPLAEMCLRTLISRPQSPSSEYSPDAHRQTRTLLESSYEIPLTEEHGLNAHILSLLRVCVPAAVARPVEDQIRTKRRREDPSERDHDVFGPSPPTHPPRTSLPASDPSSIKDLEPEEVTGSSICPSPAHRDDGGEWLGDREPVFVRPAEERFTWEDVIADVRVGGEGIGRAGVPVRWRGCSRGCLWFLDPVRPVPAQSEESPSDTGADALPPEEAPEGGEGNLDMDMDVEMEDIRLEGSLADLGDFENGF